MKKESLLFETINFIGALQDFKKQFNQFRMTESYNIIFNGYHLKENDNTELTSTTNTSINNFSQMLNNLVTKFSTNNKELFTVDSNTIRGFIKNNLKECSQWKSTDSHILSETLDSIRKGLNCDGNTLGEVWLAQKYNELVDIDDENQRMQVINDKKNGLNNTVNLWTNTIKDFLRITTGKDVKDTSMNPSGFEKTIVALHDKILLFQAQVNQSNGVQTDEQYENLKKTNQLQYTTDYSPVISKLVDATRAYNNWLNAWKDALTPLNGNDITVVPTNANYSLADKGNKNKVEICQNGKIIVDNISLQNVSPDLYKIFSFNSYPSLQGQVNAQGFTKTVLDSPTTLTNLFRLQQSKVQQSN